jgi:hypothetical protein
VIRRSSAEHARRLSASLRDHRLYPDHSLTPAQRADLHAELIAKGWREGRRWHRHTQDDRCIECGAECEPETNPLARLCERCRENRR